MVEQTPRNQNLDANNSINRLADAIAGITTQQRPQAATMLKPVSTNTLIFDGKNEKFELFEDLFHTMLKMQPEMTEAMKINNFSVFLFPKLIIDPIVIVIRHMEIKKLTGASIGFDKTLLSASYNIFVTSVLTSVFDPHAPFLAAIEQNKINPKLGGELKEMRTEEDPNTGDEHLYPIMNPKAFHSLSLSLAPVQCHFQPLTILFFFKPTDFNTLPLLDRSELLSVLGDPDLELEPFTPACLDRTPGPLFTFLTPISSRVSPIVGPAIDQSENQKQPTSNTVPVSPTFNALLYKSHPFPSCYPESEDEPRQSSSSSRRDVRPFSLHPKHFKSQSQADTVTLHWQHERLIRFPGNSYQKA